MEWRETTLGDICDEPKWPMKRLGEIAEFRNGVNYNKRSFGLGIKVVGVSNFQDYTKPKYEELEVCYAGVLSGNAQRRSSRKTELREPVDNTRRQKRKDHSNCYAPYGNRSIPADFACLSINDKSIYPVLIFKRGDPYR